MFGPDAFFDRTGQPDAVTSGKDPLSHFVLVKVSQASFEVNSDSASLLPNLPIGNLSVMEIWRPSWVTRTIALCFKFSAITHHLALKNEVTSPTTYNRIRLRLLRHGRQN